MNELLHNEILGAMHECNENICYKCLVVVKTKEDMKSLILKMRNMNFNTFSNKDKIIFDNKSFIDVVVGNSKVLNIRRRYHKILNGTDMPNDVFDALVMHLRIQYYMPKAEESESKGNFLLEF